MSNRKLFAGIGVLVAALAVLAVAVTSGGGAADAGPQIASVTVTGPPLAPFAGNGATDVSIGATAPDVTAQTFDGETVDIAADGRPKVLFFLAHWCPHCRAEVPVITEWLEDRGLPTDVDLYAVSTAVDADAPNYPPSQWLEETRLPMTVVADDGDSSVAAAFGLSSFPYFVVIGADGTVVARVSGELPTTALDALVTAASATVTTGPTGELSGASGDR
jgi:cytochrome c biogenesis protein CcmG/thiol:disulfide interchange protein DsbE